MSLLLLILAVAAGLVYACFVRAEGHFAYALDDPYIHLAIARNLAQHGIWGVTADHATAASSSPLWTVVLAAISVFAGAQVWLPFFVNLAFGCLAAWWIHRIFVEHGVGGRAAFWWAWLIAVGAPFATLAITGMEHSMQVFLVVLWLGSLLDVFGQDGPATDRQVAVLFAVGFFLMLARFESAFLFVLPFFAALSRRDKRLAAAIAGAPVAALAAFMAYCHMAGMPLLPNSIVLKGNVPHGEGVVGFFQAMKRTAEFNLFTRNGYVVTPLLVCAILSWILLRKVPSTSAIRAALGTMVVACLLHSTVAFFGNFYRYEAYVVVGFAVVLVLAIQRIPEKPVAGLANAFGILVVFVLGYRAVASMVETPRSSRDIYVQQIQMARFVGKYYDQGKVALNDIGAVSYFDNIHLLDLWGLASDDVRELKQAQRFNRGTMKGVTDAFRPDVAIVYPIWFNGGQALPDNFVPVADWQFPTTTTPAFNIIEFYGSSPAEARYLQRAIELFMPSLPKSVKVTFVKDRWPHQGG